jgi:hypothetical protein
VCAKRDARLQTFSTGCQAVDCAEDAALRIVCRALRVDRDDRFAEPGRRRVVGDAGGFDASFVLRFFKLDPASASVPFVGTLVDVTGLIIYFSIAGIVLRGSLL